MADLSPDHGNGMFGGGAGVGQPLFAPSMRQAKLRKPVVPRNALLDNNDTPAPPPGYVTPFAAPGGLRAFAPSVGSMAASARVGPRNPGRM